MFCTAARHIPKICKALGIGFYELFGVDDPMRTFTAKERSIIDDFLASYNGEPYDCIIVDEVQFLAPEIIDRLSDLVDENNITVICYGLRTDFQSHLFPGSQRLMELADDIEQIRTICWCGKRAHFNARLLNGEMVTEGEQVQLGGNESYISLCRKHYKERLIKYSTKHES